MTAPRLRLFALESATVAGLRHAAQLVAAALAGGELAQLGRGSASVFLATFAFLAELRADPRAPWLACLLSTG